MKIKEIALLSVAGFLFLGAAAFLLFYGQFKGDGSHLTPKLGLVEFKLNELRRRGDESLAWDDMFQAENVFMGDKVFTSSNSTASLKIRQKSLLDMSSLTLIRLKAEDGGGLDMLMDQGLISGEFSPKDKVSSLKTTSGLIKMGKDATNLQVNLEGESETLSILRGSAEMDFKGHKIPLTQHEILGIHKKTGSWIKEKMQFLLVSPTLQDVIELNEVPAVTFEWKALVTEEGAILFELSKDSLFKEIVFQKNVSGEQAAVASTSLVTGEYFWRVYYKNKMPQNIYAQKVNVVRNGPLALHLPLADQAFILSATEKMAEVTLEWEHVPGSDYLLELKRVGQGSSPDKLILEAKTKNPIHVQKGLEPGDYVWRVQKTSPRLKPIWSKVSKFKILPADSMIPAELIAPANQSKVNVGELVTFKWNGTPEKDYELVISHDQNFLEDAFKIKSNVLNYQWVADLPGQLYWKVLAKEGNEQAAVRSLSVNHVKEPALISPKGNKTFYMSNALQTIKFQWENIYPQTVAIRNQKYTLVVSKADKSEVIRKEVLGDSSEWTAKLPGKYSWRIESGNVSSKTESFTVSNAPALKQPKLDDELRLKIKKEKKTSYNLIDVYQNMTAQAGDAAIVPDSHVSYVTLTWPEIDGAAKYYLQIFRDKKKKELLVSRHLGTNSYDWYQAEIGVFYYRIAYIDAFGRKSNYSSISKLIVEDLLTKVSDINILYPADNYVSVGQKKEFFEWETNPGVTTFKIEIYNEGGDKLLKGFETKKSQVLLTMSEGKYKWKVIGLQNGNKMTESALRNLEVTTGHNVFGGSAPLLNNLAKNFVEFETGIGRMNAQGDVTESGKKVDFDESFNLLMNNVMFKGGYGLQSYYLTGKMSVESVTANSTSIREVDFTGHFNFLYTPNKTSAIAYGPGLKYTYLTADTTKPGLQATFNNSFLSASAHGMGIFLVPYFADTTQVIDGEFSVGLAGFNAYELGLSYSIRKSRLGWLEKWPKLFENGYVFVGSEFFTFTLTYKEWSVKKQDLRFPIGIGMNF